MVALAAACMYALKYLRGELNEKELTDAADALLLAGRAAADGGRHRRRARRRRQEGVEGRGAVEGAAVKVRRSVAGDAHVERRTGTRAR